MGAAQTELRTRNKGIRRIRVAEIEDNPLNFRTHPQNQRDALAGTINELGFYGYPDTYETDDGVIRLIDGHLRKAHLLEKYGPDAEIDVNVTDFDEAEAKKAMLTHDPLAAMAEMDTNNLDALLREVETGDAALSQMLADLVEEAKLYPEEPLPQGVPESNYSEQYGVIVVCENEAGQEAAYNKLVGLGFNCKVVTT